MKAKGIKPYLVKKAKKPLYQCMTGETGYSTAGLTRTGQYLSIDGYWRKGYSKDRLIRFRNNIRFERYIGTKDEKHIELATYDVFEKDAWGHDCFEYSLWLINRNGKWWYLGKDGFTTGPYGVSDFWLPNGKPHGVDPVSILEYI